MAEPSADSDPESANLARTRSAVLNVLVVVGGGIAASGWILGRHDPDAALPWGTMKTRQIAFGSLVALVAGSYTTLRVLTGREALRDPEKRASRFFRGRVAASIVGALAIPLGFAYGWSIDSRLQAVAPFWIAALALGWLAMPRGGELDGFDEA
jgi:hypothetical protein